MTFRDPVVDDTTLVREAIQSPNYVPGAAGWAIRADGTAEFAEAQLRGSLQAGPADQQTDIDETGVWVRDLSGGDPENNPPGLRLSTKLTQLLRDHYAAEGLSVAAGILWTFHAPNAYWYEAVTYSAGGLSYWVRGLALNLTVREIRRTSSADTAELSLRERQSAQCTSPIAPAGTAKDWQDVPGCLITIETAHPIVVWEAFYAADMNQLTGGNTTTAVRLLIDGDPGPYPQCIFNPGNTSTVTPSQRAAGLSQSADGLWLPGEHEVKLQAVRAEGTGSNRVNAVHTNLRLKLYY